LQKKASKLGEKNNGLGGGNEKEEVEREHLSEIWALLIPLQKKGPLNRGGSIVSLSEKGNMNLSLKATKETVEFPFGKKKRGIIRGRKEASSNVHRPH